MTKIELFEEFLLNFKPELQDVLVKAYSSETGLEEIRDEYGVRVATDLAWFIFQKRSHLSNIMVSVVKGGKTNFCPNVFCNPLIKPFYKTSHFNLISAKVEISKISDYPVLVQSVSPEMKNRVMYWGPSSTKEVFDGGIQYYQDSKFKIDWDDEKHEPSLGLLLTESETLCIKISFEEEISDFLKSYISFSYKNFIFYINVNDIVKAPKWEEGIIIQLVTGHEEMEIELDYGYYY